jgi:hypothetical protein
MGTRYFAESRSACLIYQASTFNGGPPQNEPAISVVATTRRDTALTTLTPPAILLECAPSCAGQFASTGAENHGAWLSLARALGSGPRGRWFKSSRPD